jgi:transmembrane sensor
MSNVYNIDRESDRDVAASRWIAKLDKGLSAAETAALRAWMQADPKNESELLEMARIWDKMDTLARLSEVFPHPGQGEVSPVPHTNHWVAVATVLLVATIGFVTLVGDLGISDRDVAPALVTDVALYETAVGGVSKVELSDGSLITLNTNSRAQINFNERRRLVLLERGEIHINVAHDPSRPLSVIVGTRIVKAVGTAFSVKIDESQRIEVIVAHGRVRVGIRAKQPPGTEKLDQNLDQSLDQKMYSDITGETLLLTQGERVVLDASSEELEVLEPEEVEVQLSWREGNLVFRGESLAVAAAEISRYTPVEFVLVDDDLMKIRVAGLFKAGDVTGFLSSLNANFDIIYEQVDEHTILLSSKKDAPN